MKDKKNIITKFLNGEIKNPLILKTNNINLCYENIITEVKKFFNIHLPHPDIINLELEKILVDDIRILKEKIFVSNFNLPRKIIIIKNLNNVNNNAFNAMLKFLEEPPITTGFLFLTNSMQYIPTTISSRSFHYFMKFDEQNYINIDDEFLGLISYINQFRNSKFSNIIKSVKNIELWKLSCRKFILDISYLISKEGYYQELYKFFLNVHLRIYRLVTKCNLIRVDSIFVVLYLKFDL